MAGTFRIKRGLRNNLCDEFLNPNIPLEDGCWYLCTDTADLFVSNDGVTLTQLNPECSFDSSELLTELEELKRTSITYVKVTDSSEIPEVVENPYIVYYSINSDGESANTYIYDAGSNKYVCTGTSSHYDLTQEKLNSMIQLIHGGSATPESL